LVSISLSPGSLNGEEKKKNHSINIEKYLCLQSRSHRKGIKGKKKEKEGGKYMTPWIISNNPLLGGGGEEERGGNGFSF